MKDEMTISQGVRSVLSSMRKHNRRTVVQSAKLKMGQNNVSCTAYDISLGGIRLKANITVEKGADVCVQIKDKFQLAAKVIWLTGGFIGLNFVESPEKIQADLGSFVAGLH